MKRFSTSHVMSWLIRWEGSISIRYIRCFFFFLAMCRRFGAASKAFKNFLAKKSIEVEINEVKQWNKKSEWPTMKTIIQEIRSQWISFPANFKVEMGFCCQWHRDKVLLKFRPVNPSTFAALSCALTELKLIEERVDVSYLDSNSSQKQKMIAEWNFQSPSFWLEWLYTSLLWFGMVVYIAQKLKNRFSERSLLLDKFILRSGATGRLLLPLYSRHQDTTLKESTDSTDSLTGISIQTWISVYIPSL